jgi:hypothetical protein
MGMAAIAPNLRDAEGISVTTHALEKLRERLPPGSHFKSMPDRDLMLRMEEAWKNEKAAGKIEEWWEKVRDSSTKTVCNFVCDLEDSFDADLVALFREDNRHPGRPTTVTVLTKPMVELNKATNKWARHPTKVGEGTLLGNGLSKQLAALAPFPVGGKVDVPADDLPISDPRSPYHNKPGFRPGDPGGFPPMPALVPPPAPKQVAIPRKPAVVAPVVPPPAAEEEMILVSWLSVTGTGARGYMTIPKSSVSGFVDELVEAGVDQSSVEFWMKREAKVRRTVVVEF